MPAWTNVKALLHLNGGDGSTTILNSSQYAHTFTASGGCELDTAQKKFGSAALLCPTPYCLVTGPNHSDFSFGTGDFTVEFWVRFQNTSWKWGMARLVKTGSSFGLEFQDYGDEDFRLIIFNGGTEILNVTWSPTGDTWHHVAVQRAGTAVRMFVDGQIIGSTTSSANFVGGTLYIGENREWDTWPFDFWMDEVRITKGEAVYAGEFEPLINPFPDGETQDPDYASVSLLLHMNGADASTTFTDDGPLAHTVTVAGNAQIDTADSYFGGASALFDGTGDQLNLAQHTAFQFGSGNFTIEGWVKFDDTTGNDVLLTYAPSGGGAAGWLIRRSGTQWRMQVYSGSSFYGNVDFGTLTTGTWYHFALVRSGNNLLRFVDGVGETPVDVTGVSVAVPTAPLLYIGSILNTYTDCLAGHLDEVRITKGVARYTANFIPPAEPFGNEAPPIPEALDAWVAAPSPLGPAQVQLTVPHQIIAAIGSPLGPALVWAYNDFSQVLPNGLERFLLDLETPTGTVRLPIKSWQGTLQAGEASYLQAVVPAAGVFIDALNAATSMTVWRRLCDANGNTVVEAPMASGPVQTVRFDQGPQQHTATISGYWQQFSVVTNPPAYYDRQLPAVRSRSSTEGGQRCRCAIDWLLQPGRRAYIGNDSFVVRWINYYATVSDAYMDVGE